MADSAGALARALSFNPPEKKDSKDTPGGYRRLQVATLDIPVQTVSVWDSVPLVQGALTDLENGQFLSASILCDATGRDDRITATLASRVNGVLSLPLEFEPGIADNAKAADVAKEAEQSWSTMFPEAELSKLIRWGRLVGAAPGEIVWDTKDTPFGKRWTPKMNVWHPQFLSWNWSWRDYQLVTQTDGIQRMSEQPGRWFLYAPNGRYLAWQTGLIRALAIPFLIRWWAYRDWARYSEKHGLPIFKAMVPKNADEPLKERYFNSMSAIGNENTIKCEVGNKDEASFDAALLEPTANTWGGFKGLIEQCDSSIAILLLGQNLTTEVKSGSLAAANVHERVRADFLRSDAVTVSSFLREEILKPWAVFNFGDPELAPWPRWRTDPPEDRKSVAEAANIASQAINTFKLAKSPVDERAFLEKLDIPLLDEAAAAKMLADQAAAAKEAATPPAPAPKKNAPDAQATKVADRLAQMDAKRMALSEEFIEVLAGIDITGLDEGTVNQRAKLIAEIGKRLDERDRASVDAKTKADQIPTSYVSGQVFIDDLVEVVSGAAADALKKDLNGVIADIQASESYEDLRHRLKHRLAGMDRHSLAKIVERATILAHTAGRKIVVDSTK